MLEHRLQYTLLSGSAAVLLAVVAGFTPSPAAASSGASAERVDPCWELEDDDCPDFATALPSRVTLNHPGLLDLRQHRHDPFFRAGADAPRLVVHARLASEGRALRFPRWRRTERRAVGGAAYPGRPSPFADLTVSRAHPTSLFPVWTADAARWGAVQEALLASSSECPCLVVPSPGEVPERAIVPGEPLRITRGRFLPTDLDLTWDASCVTVADDYSVHEGTIGSWYSHSQRTCTTGGTLFYTLTPGSGSRYYLVTPLSAAAEGSYGTDAQGVQRPVSTVNCRPSVVVEPCP